MPKPNQPLSDEEILIKHAFRGSSYAVVRLEELTEIGNLKADAVACYRPVNAQEIFAAERIALAQQQILRGARLEAGLFTTALDYCLEPNGRIFRPMGPELVGDGDIEITRAQNRNFAAGEGLRIMVKESNVWSILLRYQVNAERQYRRAIEDFDRLKRLRPEMPNHPDIGKAPDVIDDIEPLSEINSTVAQRLAYAEELAAASRVEASNVPENGALENEVPESDAPEDGQPLAPAAASTRNPHQTVSHIGARPEASRLKVKPFASPVHCPQNRRLRLVSKPARPACRPLGPPEPPVTG